MRERVLAIVSIIAQYVLGEHDTLTENDIVEELLAVGFEEEEIDAAFSWMERLSLQTRKETSQFLTLPTHRVFSAEEARALSSEAQGFLVRLRAMGIIDDEVEEEILQNSISAAEDIVSLRDIKTVAILTIFARSQNDWRRELDHILEDDWSQLYH